MLRRLAGVEQRAIGGAGRGCAAGRTFCKVDGIGQSDSPARNAGAVYSRGRG